MRSVGMGLARRSVGSKGRGRHGDSAVPGDEEQRLWHRMRIQTREDGVMIDQIVLSATKYKATRPGAVKNDTTILLQTIPWD